MRLIDRQGHPQGTFLALLERYGFKGASMLTPLKTIDAFLQNSWQKPQLMSVYPHTANPPEGADYILLQKLGYMDSVHPPTGHETESWGPSELGDLKSEFACLLMGTDRKTVVSRLHFLKLFHKSHTVPNLLYLMGSTRTLDPETENLKALCTAAELPFKDSMAVWPNPPATEAQMMEYVWQQSILPDQWQYIVFNGKTCEKTPDPANMARQWLLSKTSEARLGMYLVGSSQPYIHYHALAVERTHEFLINTGLITTPCYFRGCGPIAPATLPLATYLDCLAKQFSEEMSYQKWWRGIVHQIDGKNNHPSVAIERGRTAWGARDAMLAKLSPYKGKYELDPKPLAGPFTSETEAKIAPI